MKAKYFIAGALTAVLIVFATGADNSKPKPTQWEYAVYIHDQDLSWQEPAKLVLAKLPDVDRRGKDDIGYYKELGNAYGERNKIFISKMGIDIDPDKYLISHLLNHAGQDGWEIVSTTTEAVYFKRPKQ